MDIVIGPFMSVALVAFFILAAVGGYVLFDAARFAIETHRIRKAVPKRDELPVEKIQIADLLDDQSNVIPMTRRVMPGSSKRQTL